jgi:hypothetical protein
MGAEFCFVQLTATDDATARVEAEAICDEARYDYGHAGYSGSFAEKSDFEFVKQKFATIDQAEDYINEHAEKWGEALIARTDEGYCLGAWCSS